MYAQNQNAIVQLVDVNKIYGQAETRVVALERINLNLYRGQFTAIVGPSGSGKSTLLHCLAGLDNVTNGQVWVNGQELSQLNDSALTLFRRKHIGFIFQAFNLIPTLTAAENITLPQKLAHQKIDKNFFSQIVSALGLKERLQHHPAELSGGQQQRVAVARALLAKPSLIVADEPTGNLDSRSGQEVLSILKDAVIQLGQTVIMVTHDRHAAMQADRVICIKDGQVAADLFKPSEASLAQII